MRRPRYLALLLAAALVAAPAVAQATHNGRHDPGTRSCRTINVGLLVKGTFVGFDASTNVVTITVTGGNRHARRAFDANPTVPGFQPGAEFKFDADQLRKVTFIRLLSFNQAAVGDRVFVQGRIPVRTRRCADGGTFDKTAIRVRHAVVKDTTP